MQNIPGLMKHFCDALWEYDLEKNQIYLHFDGMTPQLCGQWRDYRELSRIYREQYVHPIDLDIWDSFVSEEKLRGFGEKEGEELHFFMRFKGKNETLEWHEVFVEKTRPGFLMIVSRDIQRIQRNESIAKAVEQEFDYVCYIDIATNSYALYTSGKEDTIVPEHISPDYRKTLYEFNQQYVVPEEALSLSRRMEISHVVEELSDKEEYILFATTIENGRLLYKKLRFCYLNEKKEKLLLSRMDVTDIVRAQKLLTEEEKKRLGYLDNLPIACCSTRVLVDEQGKPYDFEFVYSNKEHSRLEGAAYGELIGKRFYEFFKDADREWLYYYHDTAYNGVSHIMDRYSPEIGKQLLIYTFQTEPGYCECVVQDITERRFLETELEKSREEMKRVLEETTDLVFEYDLERECIIPFHGGRRNMEQAVYLRDLESRLEEGGLIEKGQEKVIRDTLEMVRQGAHEASLDLRISWNKAEGFRWFKITLFDYKEAGTHERRVLGYVQNTELIMSQQEALKEQAERDALTGILNARAGRSRVEKKLEAHGGHWYNVMFIMDIDDFKQINDTSGHMAGDQALKEFAAVLQKTFRSGDVVYRMGGDEFAVFADRIYDPEKTVKIIMDRFSRQIREAGNRGILMTSSVGVYAARGKCEFETYYSEADRALYQTKKKGKNGYTLILGE